MEPKFHHPSISVIIPAYNAFRTLPKAVSCILSSDYDNFDITIVDDAGDTRVENYIDEHPKIRVERNQINRGPAYCRNRGARVAQGDILLFIDSDVYIKNFALRMIQRDFDKFNYDAVSTLYDLKAPHNNFFPIFI